MNHHNAQQYWENRLSQQYNLQQVGYYKLGEAYNRWLYKIRVQVLQKALKTLHLPNKTALQLLEIGLGDGFYLCHWQQMGIQQVQGVDIAQTVVDSISKQFSAYQFQRRDIGQALPSNAMPCYHLIHASDVLFHITSDQHYQQAIANIAQQLLPNGYFIFSEVLTNQLDQSHYYKVRPTQFIDQSLANHQLQVLARYPIFCLMHPPTHPNWVWKILFRLLALSPRIVGNALGAMLYPIESIALRYTQHSPALTLLVCQKSS